VEPLEEVLARLTAAVVMHFGPVVVGGRLWRGFPYFVRAWRRRIEDLMEVQGKRERPMPSSFFLDDNALVYPICPSWNMPCQEPKDEVEGERPKTVVVRAPSLFVRPATTSLSWFDILYHYSISYA
jgi:hypothetical protein